MTTTRTPSTRKDCRTKKGYTSRAAAEVHRDRLIADGAEPRTLDVYWCLRHARYHVGHVGAPGRSL